MFAVSLLVWSVPNINQDLLKLIHHTYHIALLYFMWNHLIYHCFFKKKGWILSDQILIYMSVYCAALKKFTQRFFN